MASVQAPPRKEETPPPAAKFPWITLAWFGGLLLLAYLPILQRLFRQWMEDENMGHGLFVPIIAAYIAWQKRPELLAIRPSTNWMGLAVIAWASLQSLIGTLGAELFLQRTAFVIAVIGMVLLLGGMEVVKALAFPLLLLFFMIPLPSIVFNQITVPLQLLASEVAEETLMLIGIPVLREGNLLTLPSQTLSVVEACSGIRSLLSLSFLALVYGWFFETRTWVRVVLFFASVPTAIVANAGRVTLTGILSEYDKELAEGFFHSVEGWVIFVISLAMLLLVHWIIKRGIAWSSHRTAP